MCGKSFNSLIWKHINGGRNLLCCELSILHRRKTLLSEDHMKWVTYVLIMWENFGTKFFFNFIGGKTSKESVL